MRSITHLASEKLVHKFVETNGGLLVDILKLQHFTGCNSEVRLPPCVDRVMHGFTKYFRSTYGLFHNLYRQYSRYPGTSTVLHVFSSPCPTIQYLLLLRCCWRPEQEDLHVSLQQADQCVSVANQL